MTLLFDVKENIWFRLQSFKLKKSDFESKKGHKTPRNVKETIDTFSFTCYNNSCQETQHTGGHEP